ncbi:hypothetical protein LTR36_005843 [Oleoguttula mirabilis]|uniref:Uncharacterized protein n=1 Tax=Oleoguttula mirabilis TaxID=1507867 RepID=A0AAV9JCW0_9PEZI|nr:hypothetical protein LTR36_005843 [Oleoguttula mirabilis]
MAEINRRKADKQAGILQPRKRKAASPPSSDDRTKHPRLQHANMTSLTVHPSGTSLASDHSPADQGHGEATQGGGLLRSEADWNVTSQSADNGLGTGMPNFLPQLAAPPLDSSFEGCGSDFGSDTTDFDHLSEADFTGPDAAPSDSFEPPGAFLSTGFGLDDGCSCRTFDGFHEEDCPMAFLSD